MFENLEDVREGAGSEGKLINILSRITDSLEEILRILDGPRYSMVLVSSRMDDLLEFMFDCPRPLVGDEIDLGCGDVRFVKSIVSRPSRSLIKSATTEEVSFEGDATQYDFLVFLEEKNADRRK